MKKSFAIVLCACLVAPGAGACGMTSKLTAYEPVAGSVPVTQAHALLPAPVAVVTGFVRGIGPKHSTCDDTGLLSVEIEWPRGEYKLRDLGFEFKVVSGTTAYAIFPEGPVQAPISGRRGDFLFMWQEGEPSLQQPIDLQVEVRAVTRDNLRGPPTRIVVRAAPGA
ncbi:MAG: hypothetical protein ABI538_00560 [Pseudoxanthomonas sp.]